MQDTKRQREEPKKTVEKKIKTEPKEKEETVQTNKPKESARRSVGSKPWRAVKAGRRAAPLPARRRGRSSKEGIQARRASSSRVVRDRRRTRQSTDTEDSEPDSPQKSHVKSALKSRATVAVSRLPALPSRVTASELVMRKESPLLQLMRAKGKGCGDAGTSDTGSATEVMEDDDCARDEGAAPDAEERLQKSPKASRSPFSDTMIKVPRKHMPPLYLPSKPTLNRPQRARGGPASKRAAKESEEISADEWNKIKVNSQNQVKFDIFINT